MKAIGQFACLSLCLAFTGFALMIFALGRLAAAGLLANEVNPLCVLRALCVKPAAHGGHGGHRGNHQSQMI